ncbi:LysE family translocator [Rhizobium lusitanum]|uniref:LysE family translocator n=1 Tax=Rhizobium lusitanum TaxID=293958 RepID=UPI003369C176
MAATPGPNNTMATASGANYGLIRTLPLMSGIAVGVAVIMFTVAVFGASVVAEPRVSLVLKWIGITYLLWIAWQIASAEPKLADTDPKSSCSAKPPFLHAGYTSSVRKSETLGDGDWRDCRSWPR